MTEHQKTAQTGMLVAIDALVVQAAKIVRTGNGDEDLGSLEQIMARRTTLIDMLVATHTLAAQATAGIEAVLADDALDLNLIGKATELATGDRAAERRTVEHAAREFRGEDHSPCYG
jgi:hypothetical protein